MADSGAARPAPRGDVPAANRQRLDLRRVLRAAHGPNSRGGGAADRRDVPALDCQDPDYAALVAAPDPRAQVASQSRDASPLDHHLAHLRAPAARPDPRAVRAALGADGPAEDPQGIDRTPKIARPAGLRAGPRPDARPELAADRVDRAARNCEISDGRLAECAGSDPGAIVASDRRDVAAGNCQRIDPRPPGVAVAGPDPGRPVSAPCRNVPARNHQRCDEGDATAVRVARADPRRRVRQQCGDVPAQNCQCPDLRVLAGPDARGEAAALGDDRSALNRQPPDDRGGPIPGSDSRPHICPRRVHGSARKNERLARFSRRGPNPGSVLAAECLERPEAGECNVRETLATDSRTVRYISPETVRALEGNFDRAVAHRERNAHERRHVHCLQAHCEIRVLDRETVGDL